MTTRFIGLVKPKGIGLYKTSAYKDHETTYDKLIALTEIVMKERNLTSTDDFDFRMIEAIEVED